MATKFLVFNKTTQPVVLAVGDVELPPAATEGGIGDIIDVTDILSGLSADDKALVRTQILAGQVGLVLPQIKGAGGSANVPSAPSVRTDLANPKGISLSSAVPVRVVTSPPIKLGGGGLGVSEPASLKSKK